MCHRPRSPRTLNIYPRSASGCLPLSVPGIMRLSIVTILSLLFAAFSFCSGFVQRPVMTTSVGAVLFLFDNEQQEQCIGDSYADAATDCSSIFERLNERKLQLTKGVGKVRWLETLFFGISFPLHVPFSDILSSNPCIRHCVCSPHTRRQRYVVQTKKGFLNVYKDPKKGPFCTDNIVGKLEEGHIVTSTGEPFGIWIQHDGGGWSVSQFEEFKWLKPLESEELEWMGAVTTPIPGVSGITQTFS